MCVIFLKKKKKVVNLKRSLSLSLSLSLCIDIDMCMRKSVRRGGWKRRYVGLSEFKRRELFSVGYHLRGGGK
jgi:hypothetical protein